MGGIFRELLFASDSEEGNASLLLPRSAGTGLSPSKGDQTRWFVKSREVGMAGDVLLSLVLL